MRERTRRHDDAHFPMGGRGKRSNPPVDRTIIKKAMQDELMHGMKTVMSRLPEEAAEERRIAEEQFRRVEKLFGYEPLRPYCQVCGWRKGGPDSWNGVTCKCGYNDPPIRRIEPSQCSEQENACEQDEDA